MARRAEQAAVRLLAEAGEVAPPVNVERLAAHVGVVVSRSSFKDGDVSGMLIRRDGQSPVVGVNDVHSDHRQRFTIAHELGHFLLHPGREVVLDRPVRVNLRDKTSSMATDREEIEANSFAASLLMPADLIRSELQRLSAAVRLDPDRCTRRLAEIFDVSDSAMGFRLINLGLVS
ncbi:ImmA/IrrE family metallo-endopeptidase [Streptomyces sp. NBC_00638]|uniref:ImmA/IrrE family metallo-endopeptidase n=1 Tax=Streptomyces sp. NBC_00638 TaxID=2975794 RepID=UPI00225A0C23|nr:ImmA/IrrE family metallo-endopeptidase [Streptomyces sp. NBC_00638]MCX5006678.1 ImmA/IrrE family metallo-endopeptidase [Streptomyces sp. NBC_00638]